MGAHIFNLKGNILSNLTCSRSRDRRGPSITLRCSCSPGCSCYFGSTETLILPCKRRSYLSLRESTNQLGLMMYTVGINHMTYMYLAGKKCGENCFRCPVNRCLLIGLIYRASWLVSHWVYGPNMENAYSRPQANLSHRSRWGLYKSNRVLYM